jgi:lauroyl/myristoyl acyltransferase
VRCILEGARYRMAFEEPLELDARLPKGEGERELLTRLNALYERWIRPTPEQWAWHQARWRTQPGELDPAPLSEQRRRERLRRLAAGREVVPDG